MPDVSPQIPEVSPTQHLKQARPRAIESFTSSRMPGGRLGGLVTEAGLFGGGRLSNGRKPSGFWVECSSRPQLMLNSWFDGRRNSEECATRAGVGAFRRARRNGTELGTTRLSVG
ncbi:hypothetical protein GE21DRAFT_7900 [Neurospora crassa]|uniref:Uncharacterized protein n=1 Tax=Neurospora crassa (strain ATCC 24698 / 74-OR23-1A / CBS 708.71 / DSM 1257 / FGSC 987) TaxID=367110 RepID=V5ILH2_NEUCR|nr:hypothetical protein NCU06667 [Neurospora crassa OR74A]ESA42583.1 hypothetical protein NCU06667 [Neurospora crassa OR74A]KHE86944.1 hypothetical protein GE21DRAFT_7900 [Neurospora crassa]|eukprot:XP_011394687.1 hypothetical protein NCU06667 [Neurospora crassa OR74A]